MFKAKKLLSLFVGAAMTANIFATMPFTAFADNEIETKYVTESSIEVPDEFVTVKDENIKEYYMDLDLDISIPNYASYEYEKTVTIDGVLFDANGQIEWDTFPIEKAKEILSGANRENISKIYLNDETRCLSIKDLDLEYGIDYTFTCGDFFRGGIFIEEDENGNENKKISLLNLILDTSNYKNILEDEYAQNLINEKGWNDITDPYQLYYEIYQYFQKKKYVGWWREKVAADGDIKIISKYNGIEYIDCTGKVTNTTIGVALTDCYICAGISLAIEDVLNNLNREDINGYTASTYGHLLNVIKINDNYYLSDATNSPEYLIDMNYYETFYVNYKFENKATTGKYEDGSIKIPTNIKHTDNGIEKEIVLVNDITKLTPDELEKWYAVNISEFISTETVQNPIKHFDKYVIYMHNVKGSNINNEDIEIIEKNEKLHYLKFDNNVENGYIIYTNKENNLISYLDGKDNLLKNNQLWMNFKSNNYLAKVGLYPAVMANNDNSNYKKLYGVGIEDWKMYFYAIPSENQLDVYVSGQPENFKTFNVELNSNKFAKDDTFRIDIKGINGGNNYIEELKTFGFKSYKCCSDFECYLDVNGTFCNLNLEEEISYNLIEDKYYCIFKKLDDENYFVDFYDLGDIDQNYIIDSNDIQLLTNYLINKYHFIQTGCNDDLTITASNNLNVNGDIYSNGTFTVNSNNVNLNGTVYANNFVYDADNLHVGQYKRSQEFEIDNLLSDDYIINNYFSGSIEVIEGLQDTYNKELNKVYEFKQNPTEIMVLYNSEGEYFETVYNSYIYGNGCVYNGNFNLIKNHKCVNDFSVQNSDLFSTNGLIYSQNGNISINSKNCTINGIIYAPNGTVTIDSENLNINGLIIANKIIVNATSCINFNVNNKLYNNKIVLSNIQLKLADLITDDLLNIFDLVALKRKVSMGG